MHRFAIPAGKMGRLGLVALAVVAIPAASAFASAEDPTAKLSAEQVEKGRQMFSDNGCNSCHTLADAKAAGSVGPSFDGNANINKAHVVDIVTNGQGAMPSFSWLEPADIDLLASYIVQAKK
ncbi:MAG: c-type cytochrome [Porphyrobacter sp.]|nr:c-type cytochrome [Porphyrobacter sp.]